MSLTLILERNAEIRRYARNSLPSPNPLDVEDLVDKVGELLNLMGREIPAFSWEEDVPSILKVKVVLALLTEELRSFTLEATMANL